jgi:hypothetical protein
MVTNGWHRSCKTQSGEQSSYLETEEHRKKDHVHINKVSIDIYMYGAVVSKSCTYLGELVKPLVRTVDVNMALGVCLHKERKAETKRVRFRPRLQTSQTITHVNRPFQGSMTERLL